MPDVGITIVVGVPGGGKSLFAVEDMAYNPGMIVSNIRLTDRHPAYHRAIYIPSDRILQYSEPVKASAGVVGKPARVTGFWELPGLERDYTIYIDEADIYFDCMDHRGLLQGDIFRFLKQHRKRNIRMVFIVQSAANIWNRIRRLTQDVVLCHKDSSGRNGWMPKMLQRFVRVRYPDDRMRGEPTSVGFMLERRAREIYTWYDSSELI